MIRSSLQLAPKKIVDGTTEIEARLLDLKKRLNDVAEIHQFVERKKQTLEMQIKLCNDKILEIQNSYEQADMFLDLNNF